MNTNEKHERILPNVEVGKTFTIGEFTFIRFPDVDGMTPVVMKDVAFRSRFGDNNDLRASVALKRMQKEILPKIIEAVGEENVCTFKTDLTTLDGLKPYGDLESRISLYTLDFYRANVEIFDQYKVDCHVFLATPESAQPHDEPNWILCVSPSGVIGYYDYYVSCGVRPILYFKSSIFGSFEE